HGVSLATVPAFKLCRRPESRGTICPAVHDFSDLFSTTFLRSRAELYRFVSSVWRFEKPAVPGRILFRDVSGLCPHPQSRRRDRQLSVSGVPFTPRRRIERLEILAVDGPRA